jgi:hypothetical protein
MPPGVSPVKLDVAEIIRVSVAVVAATSKSRAHAGDRDETGETQRESNNFMRIF